MKKLLLLSLLLSIFIATYSQNMSLDWAYILSDSSGESGFHTATDSQGNVYLYGMYYGISLPNTPWDSTASRYNEPVYFIQKLNSQGNEIWLKELFKYTSLSSNDNTALFIDSYDNLYVSALFAGKVDADPGDGIFELDTGDEQKVDASILKLDSDGDFIWAGKIGGQNLGQEFIDAIAVDSIGNMYLSGFFKREVDFDPGPGDYILQDAGYGDAYIMKLDVSGNFLWVKTLEGARKTDANILKLDSNEEPIVVGVFRATVDFDPGPDSLFVEAQGGEDIYVLKLSANGDFQWMRSVYSDNYVDNQNLAVDEQGNIFLLGAHSGEAEFNSGQGNSILRDTEYLAVNVFIQKISPQGNHIWVRSFGKSEQNRISSFTWPVGAEYIHPGRLLIMGVASGDIDYDPDTAMYKISEETGYFVGSYDATNGDFLWVDKVESDYLLYGDLASDSNYVYLAGTQIYAGDSIDHDPSCGVYLHQTTNVSTDIVLLKWKSNLQLDTSCLNVSIDQESLTQELPLNYYPNPSQGPFQLEFNQIYASVEVEIYSIEGRKIKSFHYSGVRELMMELPQHTGLYLLKIIADGKESRLKVLRN